MSEFVGVFAHFDPRDEAGDMWRWLSYAPKRKVIAWCRRLQRAGWRLPQLPDPRRDLPWSIATADELGVSPAHDRRRDGHEVRP